ncbi:MAG: S-adenosylmethionine:tRNA ribosyltransferase-isomerase [Candidatus Dormiibacterota bacterium]
MNASPARPATSLDFAVSPALLAREPAEARGLRRDEVRMLVSAPGHLSHHRALDLPEVLRAGDLVVVNDSLTLPASLDGTDGGTPIELHLSTLLPDAEGSMADALGSRASRWVVEVRTPLAIGSRASFDARAGHRLALAGGARATVLHAPLNAPPHAPPAGRERSRLWIADLRTPGPLGDHLERYGEPIRYDYMRERWPIADYRAAVGRELGSAEMPSASRPLTDQVLARLQGRGVGIATITLHCGVSSLESGDPPYPEWFSVPAETAAAIGLARRRGGRVLAVGTTVIRALESALGGGGEVHARAGWTGLMVTPERPIRAVDGILTGWHEPQATHLAMLAALAGPELLQASYRAALAGGYLWHEFGDVHLLLRRAPGEGPPDE